MLQIQPNEWRYVTKYATFDLNHTSLRSRYKTIIPTRTSTSRCLVLLPSFCLLLAGFVGCSQPGSEGEAAPTASSTTYAAEVITTVGPELGIDAWSHPVYEDGEEMRLALVVGDVLIDGACVKIEYAGSDPIPILMPAGTRIFDDHVTINGDVFPLGRWTVGGGESGWFSADRISSTDNFPCARTPGRVWISGGLPSIVEDGD